MTLDTLTVRLGTIVGAMLFVAAVAIVGRDRLADVRADLGVRIRKTAPSLGILTGVLLVNSVVRRVGQDVSWVVGLNITGVIYALEGTVVASLQSIAVPPLTLYFSFMYIYGYVFLLAFPLIAYFSLEGTRCFRETCLAYAMNYAIGLLCYVVFIAFGPRNLMPDVVEPLLYTSWPQSQLLTRQVNANTNVFPSLHSSLSITVALLAYRTRDVYPIWPYVASFFAGSILVSTMYLGIHWLSDVVAGGGLALLAVAIATNVVGDSHSRYPGTRSTTRLLARFTHVFRSLREK